ncbi:carbonic anhydrase [Microbacterium sp. SYP-A9085]|jgi:carbonic anhydrase|uniref:carbonic anhydrase n=1 Tax=Microbacterium sp. SYP-A9085 TaxID=2664454 RepID=UPI00129BB997|nr:carbonic anhydrase [Microbacterium sp. SYP-A9085]MRH28651.1 carbonic anhydrase [Microbacterium sp. SYP-A9085]
MTTTRVRLTPQQAWDRLAEGNTRFVEGTVLHPRQSPDRRRELTDGQHPHAVVFGCSDSRPASEIVFDEGLGDMFVVRNAGQVVSPSAVGSIEFAVAVLDVPLLVVLGHEACGAVRAAIDSTRPDAPELPAQIWRLIAPIVPTVHRVARSTRSDPSGVDAAVVGREHLSETVQELLQASPLIADAVAAGRLGIVGAVYQLGEGTVVPHVVEGALTVAGK